MLRVAFDLDNVVVDIVAAARDALAAAAGIPAAEIVTTSDYKAPFSHPDAAIRKRLATPHEFWQREDVLAAAKPLPGARRALMDLAEAEMLAAYITRRAPRARGITQAWLEIHDMPTVPLHLVGHHDVLRNGDACKARICRDIGATHLVDDSQHEAERALPFGIAPILVDHPLGRPMRSAWRSMHPEVVMVDDATDAAAWLLRGAAAVQETALPI